MESVDINQSVTARRAAREVWAALSALDGAAMPRFVDYIRTDGDSVVQRIKFSEKVVLEQRIVELNDDTMQLRAKMIGGQSVPWSGLELHVRVEPAGPNESIISTSCRAVATTEPRLVESMLRDAILLGLKQLKINVESSGQQ